MRTTERQLAWLVRVVMSLFSYGMPSATSKIVLCGKKKSSSQDDEALMDEAKTPTKKPEFIDF